MQEFTVELQRRITQTHQVTVHSEDFEQAKQKALEIISEDNMLSQEEKITFVYLRTVFSPTSQLPLERKTHDSSHSSTH